MHIRFDFTSFLIRTLTFSAVVLFSPLGLAQGGSQANRNALTEHVQPNAGGWYQAQSNLGNINFDISDSGVVAGNWSTYRNGKSIWYYFQGQIQYPDYDESNANGVIAIAEASLVEATGGGGCLTCPFQPLQFASYGSMRIEFTSPRTGSFLFEGNSIPVVAWMQGPPLVSSRDYSGEWLALVRRFAPDTNAPGYYDPDIQLLVTGRLDPMEVPDEYEFYSTGLEEGDQIGVGEVHRRYRFTCTKPDVACQQLKYAVMHINHECVSCIPPPRDFYALFLKDDDAGQFMPMEAWRDYQDRLIYRIDNDGRYWKAYGQRDRIVIRYDGSQLAQFQPYDYVLEIIMTRLPAGLFHSASRGATP